MKALLSFALLICMLFSVSVHASVKPPVRKVMKTQRGAISWPVTGVHKGIAYTVYGSDTAPTYILFSGWGPCFFSENLDGSFSANVYPFSGLYNYIKSIHFQADNSPEGYLLTFFPDL